MLSWDDGFGPALYAGTYWDVAKWNGTSWSNLTGLSGTYQDVGALCIFNDGTGPTLYAGGDFTGPSQGIAKWTGTTWVSLPSGGLYGGGPSVWVDSMVSFDDGTGPGIYIAGVFERAYDWSTSNWVYSTGIIKWNGTSWSSLGGGVTGWTGNFPIVHAVGVYDDGSGPAIYAAGNFTSIGGVAANYVAKWDGSAWSSLGGGLSGGAASLLAFDDGSGPALYVDGVLRWNGTTWSVVGNATNLYGAYAMAIYDDGSGSALYAGCPGYMGGYYPYICRWDGVRWTSLGNGVDGPVSALAVYDDGIAGPVLYVGGSFSYAGDHLPSPFLAEWIGCRSPIEPMCVGDSSFAPCPCGNAGLAGRGCQNSTGLGGAQLSWSGTTVPDTLTLSSSFEPSTSLTIFVMGSALTETPIKFGDGIRCAGGNLLRMYVHQASAGATTAPQPGEPAISRRAMTLGFPIAPGDVRYLQAYYRDAVQAFCPPPNGSTFNITNALRVIW